MFSRSAWLHLRITFSYFLLPVFLFAVGVSPNFTEKGLMWTFITIHLFLYPASNGYNSYFDKDEKSIGGLKNPPPVNKGLYYLSLLFDAIAIGLGVLYLNLQFAIMLLIYGLVSKAYSHPSIRLKKYAILSWVITGLIQGFFTFVMCYVGINDYQVSNAMKGQVLAGAALATVMLWANYPMTQIYQHEEDAKRGDHTLSIALGIRGTFIFTGALFTLVAPAFMWYFSHYYNWKCAFMFLFALLPVVLFFVYWLVNVWKDETMANHQNAMWLNFISATCLNAFFAFVFLDSSNVLQTFQ